MNTPYMPHIEHDSAQYVVKELSEKGWIHLPSESEYKLNNVLNSLGEVIQTTDVVVKPESKSMVTSNRGLDFHSDHPAANYVVWYCLKQTDVGGESILLDAKQIYWELSPDEQKELHNIYLHEHKVFSDDKEFYPMVETVNGKQDFYFSFWLVKDIHRNSQAFKKFYKLTQKAEHIRLILQPHDILIIDNKRMLHGRTPITGNENRHLKRYWVSKNKFHNQIQSLNMETTTLKLPSPIIGERINYLIEKGIDKDIAAIDLEMVKMKLLEEKEGIGWTVEQVNDAEIEYKRYLHLTRHFPYPKFSIVPNKIMDTVWHYHILDTKAYHRDCEKTFGHYLHHYPYFGLRGEDDAKNLRTQFEKTKEYYLQSFGEDMARNKEADCWHDCEDRCWHACDNSDDRG